MSANRYSVTVVEADGGKREVFYRASTSLAWTVRVVESFGETYLNVNGARFDGTVEAWFKANGAEVVS